MSAKTIVLKGAEVLSVKLNAYPVEFKKEVKARMKELGYANYAKFTYKGMMFTSHEKEFIDIYLTGKKPAMVELKEDFILDEEGKPTEKLGLTLVDYHSKADVASIKAEEFRDSLMNVENFIKHPELLNQLDLIDKLVEIN